MFHHTPAAKLRLRTSDATLLESCPATMLLFALVSMLLPCARLAAAAADVAAAAALACSNSVLLKATRSPDGVVVVPQFTSTLTSPTDTV